MSIRPARQILGTQRSEPLTREGTTGFVSPRPCCLWFTGLSGAGKSTLAALTAERLKRGGVAAVSLDGDVLRDGICKDLGFSAADRTENVRRTAHVAKLFVDSGSVAVVSLISPYRRDRELARRLFAEGDFFEIFVDTAIAECERRDPKGLYARARAGKIPEFTGLTSPYEAPLSPEIRLNGSSAADEFVERILQHLQTAWVKASIAG